MTRPDISRAEARSLYRSENAAGRGYPPCGDEDTIDDAVRRMVSEGGEVILERRTSDDIAVVREASGWLVGIGGDAAGRNAWCVSLLHVGVGGGS